MFFYILQNPAPAAPVFNNENHQVHNEIYPASNGANTLISGNPSVILPGRSSNVIQPHEEVEESLSIMDKEKELIIKALKKHRGKRKDASLDLGISERTLYRKLKEYDIEDL